MTADVLIFFIDFFVFLYCYTVDILCLTMCRWDEAVGR